MKARYTWVPFAVLCASAAPAVGNGTVDILTPAVFDVAIVVDVVVVDDGAGAGCTSFTLQRRRLLECDDDANYVTVASFSRQTGTVTHQVIDHGLQPNTAYKYRILPCTGFSWAYDCGWGLNITALAATTGPGLTAIGHGELVCCGTPLGLVYCDGWDCGGANVNNIPPEAAQYVESGIPVILYGTFERTCQWEWFYQVTQVVPAPCTVAVEAATWSATKMMFR
jgi:hypothetical protein